MRQIIGQHLFIGVSGKSLTPDEKVFIIENNIGGICLFGRNVAEPNQVADLCAEIQELRFKMADRAPLFIGIDMEGGRVHRLKTTFTQFPAVQHLGVIDNPVVTFNFALRMGLELRSVGINLNFSPCADVYTNPANTIIGDRSFGTDPELVARHVSATARGFVKSGVIACAKHFPGHGNTLLDSHLDLPIEKESTWDSLDHRELIPFKKAIRSRIDMIMSAHIMYPEVDPNWPATLSYEFLTKRLRDELHYRGLIITDDLGMKAMSAHYAAEEIPVRAMLAGADLLLYCNEPEIPPLAIDALLEANVQGRLSSEKLRASHQRILDFKRQRLEFCEPATPEEISSIVGTPEHKAFAQAISEHRTPEGLFGAGE